MASLPEIDNKTARAIFLARHGLSENPTGASKGPDLRSVIEQLGFVQIDSINTVSRAHHMILHARQTSYRPRHLDLFHERDRGAFEHWTHDASLISMPSFPHWRLKFARHQERNARRWDDWRSKGIPAKIDAVLRQISDEGPCGSTDVGQDETRSSGGWWEWHPSKIALEYLWRIGELSVTRREGFRKVYDLTERVIPAEFLNARFSEEDTIDWACRSALDRLGFATSGELAAFWDLISPREAKMWCADLVVRGELTEAWIQQADGSLRKSFLWPETLEEPVSKAPTRIRVLSPFDPALRDRKRAERLLGFSYRIEVFVPEAKREYGYYVFPILEGDRLIGRIDMKAERDVDRLHVRALWPEAGIRFGSGRVKMLNAALARTSKLAGVSAVSFEPDWLQS